MCHCDNTGMERTPNESQHTSWLWRRKFSRFFCRDLNSQPFDHKSGALTNKLSCLYRHYVYSRLHFGLPDDWPSVFFFGADFPPLVLDCERKSEHLALWTCIILCGIYYTSYGTFHTFSHLFIHFICWLTRLCLIRKKKEFMKDQSMAKVISERRSTHLTTTESLTPRPCHTSSMSEEDWRKKKERKRIV